MTEARGDGERERLETASQLDSGQTCQGRLRPTALLWTLGGGNEEGEYSAIFILFLNTSFRKKIKFSLIMFLAAAVSAACSLKVIIPQHPAPVVRKCNVLSS